MAQTYSKLYYYSATVTVKTQQEIPDFLMYTDITSFYKLKGERKSLENDRGFFGIVKIRSILDKLAYNDYYETVDGNMSDSNVGGRKNRNIHDNLFVVYAIRNEAIKKKIAVSGSDGKYIIFQSCLNKYNDPNSNLLIL